MPNLAKVAFPTTNETQSALRGQEVLLACLDTFPETLSLQISGDPSRCVELPASALRLLVDILAEFAEGNAVQVVPVHAEMTTQEAADLLNVSRPHLVKLLEDGILPFHKAGKHRRLRVADVLAFKARQEHESKQAMLDLAKQAQELRMGYE